MKYSFTEILAKVAISILVLVGFYMTFVIVPVDAYTQSECLKQGYTHYSVTANLDRYCISYDGAVKPTVMKQ